MHNKHGHENRYIVKALGQYGTKAIRRFSSLEAWKHFRKSRSLEVWKSGGLKRRLLWDFACADFINPLSCQASRLPNFRNRKAIAFTMAEILISLTIIGIIAAITLPSLRANINESAWATQRKALYSRMSQAIAMMPSLNGYGIVMNSDGTVNETETASKATQTFISEGLSKVLKINNICDGSTVEAIEKCGFPKKFTKMGTKLKMDTPIILTELNSYFNMPDGQYLKYSQIDTRVAAFETANGESVLTFYNPNCSYMLASPAESTYKNLMQPTMCANFVYDLNGKKGPNKVGKDIGFITAFYPTDTQIVAPAPLGNQRMDKNKPYPTFTVGNGNAYCKSKYNDDARMANIEELKSLFTNNKLGYAESTCNRFLVNDGYWSSSPYQGKLYIIAGYSGRIATTPISYNEANYVSIFCVKR